jgi:hypothetical protein
MNEQGRNMDTQTKEDTSVHLAWASPSGKGGEAHTTLGKMQRVASDLKELNTARGLGSEEPPTAQEQLAAIGTLRRQLVTLELRLEDATEQLKGSRQWDLVQGLKEERKLLQKKLDRAIDGTVQWAQPTMI